MILITIENKEKSEFGLIEQPKYLPKDISWEKYSPLIIYMYTCVYMYVYMHKYIYANMFIYIYIYKHPQTYMYIYTYGFKSFLVCILSQENFLNHTFTILLPGREKSDDAIIMEFIQACLLVYFW